MAIYLPPKQGGEEEAHSVSQTASQKGTLERSCQEDLSGWGVGSLGSNAALCSAGWIKHNGSWEMIGLGDTAARLTVLKRPQNL